MASASACDSEVADRAFVELKASFASDARIHLNNAGVAPLTARAERAIVDVAMTMRGGSLTMGTLLSRYEHSRAVFARLVGCEKENLAFFQTCAAAISQVAFGFPLAAGDRIVRLDQEYPSNAYPWHRAAERAGAVVDVVNSGDGYVIDHDALVAAIGPRTRVVALSFVQFQTGATVELARVVEAARRVGAVVVVDAIQGLGVLPFDMGALGIDAVCGGTHKWLLGPVGQGFLAMTSSLRERLVPILHGAISYGTPEDPIDPSRPLRRDVRRFEPGSPPFLGAIGGAASVELLLELGQPRVLREASAVAEAVVEQARRRAWAVRPRGRSPIVTVVPPGDPKALGDALNEAGISVGVRGGGLRFAPHAFNTAAEIEQAFDHVDAALIASAR
jgi:cysteine desulfurase / selenocysteine lyase